MAIYRTIQMSFWTDTKVTDDFTPEDKYFYLYLMTNPHTNLAGCYEISFTQMSIETGYTKDAIEKLIKRMEQVHQVIRYSPATKEILILNWQKYNWTSSPKFRVPLINEIEEVKNPDFKQFLVNSEKGIDTVSIPYGYGSDTTVTVTDNTKDTYNSLEEVKPLKKVKKETSKDNYINIIDESDLDIEVKEKVKQWLVYKAERKEGYKDQGFKSLMTYVKKHLTDYGIKAVCDVIDLSMSNQWKGICWERISKTGGKQSSGSAYMDIVYNRVDVVDSW